MPANELSLGRVQSSFAKSLIWVAIIISCIWAFLMISNAIKVDFLHTNPNRTQANILFTILIFIPLFTVGSFIGTALIFSASSFARAFLVFGALRKYGNKGLLLTFLFLPAMTILTWYCYEYLTPSDFSLGINDNENWVPYQFGLTGKRYLLTLLAEGFVTLFSVVRLRLEMTNRHKENTYVLLAALFLAACFGSAVGYIF